MNNNSHNKQLLPENLELQLIETFHSNVESGRNLVKTWLKQYPEYTDDIMETALLLESSAAFEQNPDPAFVAEVDKSFAIVLQQFQAQPQPASTLTLVALLESKKKRRVEAAKNLRVGVDVIDKMARGVIDISTIPETFIDTLAQFLQEGAETIRAALMASFHTPQASPALRQGVAQTAADISANKPAIQSFAEAIAKSPQMNEADRSVWRNVP